VRSGGEVDRITVPDLHGTFQSPFVLHDSRQPFDPPTKTPAVKVGRYISRPGIQVWISLWMSRSLYFLLLRCETYTQMQSHVASPLLTSA